MTLAILAGLAGVALAHARLVRAEPAPGSVLKTPPKTVRLSFSLAAGHEELDPRRSAVSVWDARGRRVDDGRGGVDLNDLDRRSMLARLKPLAPGRYTVRWKAVTTPDLAVSTGRFHFTVIARRNP